MSVEGVRVVLLHDPDQDSAEWISLLTEMCAGAKPELVSAADLDATALLASGPHRIVVLAPLDSAAYSVLMESIPLLVAAPALQSLVEALGGKCVGVPSRPENFLMHDGVGLWTGFGEPLTVAGYPAIAPDQSILPAELVVTAWNDERVALALRHRQLPLVVWNLHPNDLQENSGKELLIAFLEGKYLTGAPEGPPEI
jgi:anthranilate synthase component II